MISVLMERTDTLSGQLARLSGTVSVIEQRAKLEAQARHREQMQRINILTKELKSLEKKMRTEPIALRQIMDTWWLRIVAIAVLGMANMDLKHAIGLVFQLK